MTNTQPFAFAGEPSVVCQVFVASNVDLHMGGGLCLKIFLLLIFVVQCPFQQPVAHMLVRVGALATHRVVGDRLCVRDTTGSAN